MQAAAVGAIVLRFAASSLVVVIFAGCIGGERLSGPTVNVRNDAGRPIVVRRERSKWEIGAAESRFLTTLESTAFTRGAAFTILDGVTCEVMDSISLTFETVADPLIVVPATGATESRAMTVAERHALALEPKASLSPNVCLGPADGWNLSVVNGSDRAYHLAMAAPDRGGVANPGRALFDVSPKASGTIVWTGLVGDTVAGSIDLLDSTTCETLDSVDHPAWGNFVVTIDETGYMTIEPGELPPDGVPLPGTMSRTTESGCSHVVSARPSAR